MRVMQLIKELSKPSEERKLLSLSMAFTKICESVSRTAQRKPMFEASWRAVNAAKASISNRV